MERYHLLYRHWLCLLLLLLSAGCEKETTNALDYDGNKINLVIADNFNLSAFNAALRMSRLNTELQENKGPYTVLAPSDAAFADAGYPSPVSVLTADVSGISRIARYHTLDGRYELNKLPFLFNQELESKGGKLYATHWIKGLDTVLTINGSRLLAENIPASNGLIQVINRVLTPYVHDKITDAIAAEPDITLFSQALRSSGMLDILDGEGPYTIFAPDNAAMRAYGFSSIHQVRETEPSVLRMLVSYHIVRDRRFVYDYVLSAGPSNQSRQAMYDGNLVTINLSADPGVPGGYGGIRLQGTGNTAVVNTVSQDILAGNGVLHIIDGVLRINQ